MTALAMTVPDLEDGVFYCLDCDRARLPSFPCQGEGHAYVRPWMDGYPESDDPLVKCGTNVATKRFGIVLLDGEHEGWVYELQAGRNGWIIYAETELGASGPCLRRCGRCGIHALARFRRGHVEVLPREDEP